MASCCGTGSDDHARVPARGWASVTTRILLVSGEYPPDEGGVADYTQCLARALADRGLAVAVLCARRKALPVASARPRPDVPAVSHDPYDLYDQWDPYDPLPDPTVFRLVDPRWGWSSLATARRAARAWRADWLHLQYQAAAFGLGLPIHLLPWRLGRALPGLRLAVSYHDLREPYLFPKAGRLRPLALLALARSSHLALTTNAADRVQLARSLAARGWSGPRQALVPIGSNLPDAPPAGFDRAAFRAAAGLAPETTVLGYFGFLNASKGGQLLLGALEALRSAGRDARLAMIGGAVGASDPTNAATLAAFQASARAMGLAEAVLWTGHLPAPLVSAWLHAVDQVVLPYGDGASYRRGSLLAALVHGRPLVTTTPAPSPPGWQPGPDDADPPPLVDGIHALLCPPDDAAALGAAVLRLASDPLLAAALGRAARQLATAFGWEAIAQRHAAFYERTPPPHP